MSLTIQLLGRPCIESTRGGLYEFRSRKSWALLASILLSERPRTRSQLASLLFAEADDPLRALRWSLSEIRGAWAGTAHSRVIPLFLSCQRMLWSMSTC